MADHDEHSAASEFWQRRAADRQRIMMRILVKQGVADVDGQLYQLRRGAELAVPIDLALHWDRNGIAEAIEPPPQVVVTGGARSTPSDALPELIDTLISDELKARRLTSLTSTQLESLVRALLHAELEESDVGYLQVRIADALGTSRGHLSKVMSSKGVDWKRIVSQERARLDAV
jgi:hypothetical protein